MLSFWSFVGCWFRSFCRNHLNWSALCLDHFFDFGLYSVELWCFDLDFRFYLNDSFVGLLGNSSSCVSANSLCWWDCIGDCSLSKSHWFWVILALDWWPFYCLFFFALYTLSHSFHLFVFLGLIILFLPWRLILGKLL